MQATRSSLFKHRDQHNAGPPQGAAARQQPTTGSAPAPMTGLTPAEAHALWRSKPLERRHS